MRRGQKVFRAAVALLGVAVLYEGARWMTSENMETDIGPITISKNINNREDTTTIWINRYRNGNREWGHHCVVRGFNAKDEYGMSNTGIECE